MTVDPIMANYIHGSSKKENINNWLETRKKGIGGSDIASIAGLNPWRNSTDVYLDKLGLIKTEANEQMKIGLVLEDPIAIIYSGQKKVLLEEIDYVLQHDEYEFCLANIDRLIKKTIIDDIDNDTTEALKKYGEGILEIKNTRRGEDWVDGKVPNYYMCQLQWYLGITGLQWGQFAVLINGSNFVTSEIIMFDENLFQKLVEIANNFWYNHVKKNIPPSQNLDINQLSKIYKTKDNTIVLENNKTVNEILDEREKILTTINKLEKRKKEIDTEIYNNIKENKSGCTDKWSITKITRNSVNLDYKRLKEEHYDIYQKFSKKSESVYFIYKKIGD